MLFIRRLIWDSWNVAHIARHEVTPEEVEQVCQSDYIVFESYKGRFLVIGVTKAGQMLTVVLDPEPQEGVYYLVTARPADRKEQRFYQEQKGGEERDEQAA